MIMETEQVKLYEAYNRLLENYELAKTQPKEEQKQAIALVENGVEKARQEYSKQKLKY